MYLQNTSSMSISLAAVMLTVALFQACTSAPTMEEIGIAITPSLSSQQGHSSTQGGSLSSTHEIFPSLLPSPAPEEPPTVIIPESTQNVVFLSVLLKYLVADLNTIMAKGSPSQATMFTVEKYLNETTEKYYYKMKVEKTEEYVYYTSDHELKVGIPSPSDGDSDVFQRTELTMNRKTYVTFQDAKYGCYIGFERGKSKSGFCSRTMQYLIQLFDAQIYG